MGASFPVRYVRQLASIPLCCYYHDPPPSTYKLIPTNYVSPIIGLVKSYQNALPQQSPTMFIASALLSRNLLTCVLVKGNLTCIVMCRGTICCLSNVAKGFEYTM